MEKIKAVCENCKYWSTFGKPKDKMDGHTGECRRYAPRPILQAQMCWKEATDEDNESAEPVWPITGAYGWCGEWQLREKPEE